MRIFTIGFVLLLSALCCFVARGQQRKAGTARYFVTPTLPQDVHRVQPIPIDTGGVSASKDTLFQLLSAHGDPISYYRKIITEVCFDGNCRLLRVNLYWNITGRYLGFELPPKEFLSKAEHEPFNAQEYLRLHAILGDSLSPIGAFSYQDLIPKSDAGGLLDGVTGPTSKDVLQYVVKGAVFTTYTMWKLVYGRTQAEVEHATERALSASYLLDILNSTNTWDRYWALDRLRLLPEAPKEVKDRILEFVRDDAYNLAARAIEVIPLDWCADSAFQQALWSEFDGLQYALKPMLLKKLGVCENIDRSVLLGIADRLSAMNGPVLVAGLECLRSYLPGDPALLQRARALLNHENQYIVNQAKKLLDEVVAADR